MMKVTHIYTQQRVMGVGGIGGLIQLKPESHHFFHRLVLLKYKATLTNIIWSKHLVKVDLPQNISMLIKSYAYEMIQI